MGIEIKNLSIDDFIGLPVLIGNGLSIRINENYRYDNLVSKIQEKCSDSLYSVMNNLDEKNIEKLLLLLESSIHICDLCDINPRKIHDLKKELRNEFLSVVHELHPDSHEFNNLIYSGVGDELDNFGDIFTTNYDFTLYYLILKFTSHWDGFGNSEYDDFKVYTKFRHFDQKYIFYLHGNLLLFENGNDTFKITSGKSDYGILEMIDVQVKKDNFPLIVAEGRSESKEMAIKENKYLELCFHYFTGHKSDELVIFGHSLGETDSHIIDAINSNFARVYYGLYDKSESERNLIKSKLDDVEITFFDSNIILNPEDYIPPRSSYY